MITAAATALALSFFLTPLFRAWSVRRGLLDNPNERSSHTIPTPRSGGKAMVVALVCAFLVARLAGLMSLTLLAIVAPVALSGLIDDLRGLEPLPKFLLQFLSAAAYVALSWHMIEALDFGVVAIPFGRTAAVVTVLWLIGFTNFFNFMDGVNGIAAAQAIVSGVVLTVLALRAGDGQTMFLALSVAAVALGFLPWNLTGRIFMGDTGSATIGFLLALCAVRIGTSSFVLAILPMLPFLFDTVLTLVMRIARRERVSQAHRSHLYQRLTDLGWSHLAVTMLYTSLAAIGGIVALSTQAVLVPFCVLLLAHAVLAAAILTRHRRVTALPQRASGL